MSQNPEKKNLEKRSRKNPVKRTLIPIDTYYHTDASVREVAIYFITKT
jgi:hypothetical protein